MKRNKFLFLSLLSAALFSISWPATGNLAPLLFIAFTPLLYLEYLIYNNQGQYKNHHLFNYSFIAFFAWNLATTWWIYNASGFGMVMAVLLNSLYMSLVMLLFHITKKKIGEKQGYISLIFYWIAFEYFHLDWDLSWPWLTLGNGFANYTPIIQWYEFTGTLGGSFWILLLNILIFYIFKSLILQGKNLKEKSGAIIITGVILFIPMIISALMYNLYTEQENPVNVVVVQPNIDPYNEKFSGSPEKQLDKMLQLGASLTDSNTNYIVNPETALPQGLWENELQQSEPVNKIKAFIEGFPQLNYVTGLASFKAFSADETPSLTARMYSNGGGYYDAYNTAMQLDRSPEIQLYHKSILVPGVEKMPFPSVFKYLEDFAVDLGGMSGSHGIDKERKVFISHDKKTKIAPVICYESIYGEYVAEYVKNGANLIFIITNDGWWGNTSGYRQHLSYARLRTIETRRSIARSANTGISCFINQRGDILQPTGWWEPAVIKGAINSNDEITFYTRHGDYIGRTSMFIAFLLLLLTTVKSFNKGKSLR